MRRALLSIGLSAGMMMGIAAPALACGGLVNPNGTVSLLRTSTLVGYVDGVEHYVTSFEFAGGGSKFGSIVPLPAVPTDVKRAGDWTLQRLAQEVAPPVAEAALADDDSATAFSGAEVIYETKIDALDITILKGGGDEVGRWAEGEGFALTPDAPEVLDFYARRSPIFMAASFDVARAEDLNQSIGDGTPIHLTIPTDRPWVPLRILALGRKPQATVSADVFLLTDRAPVLLPAPKTAGTPRGMILERSEEASSLLLADLREDKGMGWIPEADMWFTYLRIDKRAGKLVHDLAVNVNGGEPDWKDAGYTLPPVEPPSSDGTLGTVLVVVSLGTLAVLLRRRVRRARR
ncbi:MAG: DUF2330 domain-containing protein [Actinomycetota bacterium]